MKHYRRFISKMSWPLQMILVYGENRRVPVAVERNINIAACHVISGLEENLWNVHNAISIV